MTVVMTLLGWSAVPLFIQHFSTQLDAWTSNGWRYGLAALIWAPVLIVGAIRGTLPKALARKAILPSVFNATGQTVFAFSFYHVDPAVATFGLRSQIVFVAIGAYLLFPSERALLRTPLSWLGILLVLCGVGGTLFLKGPAGPTGSVGVHASHGLGVSLAVAGGLLFAAYGLSVRRGLAGINPVIAFASISQYTALILVSAMLVMGRNKAGVADLGLSAWMLSTNQFFLLLLSSIIGIALGHVFYYIAIARLGVAVSTGVVQLQPFVVAIAQLLLNGVLLTGAQWFSGSLAVVGAGLLLTVQWRLSRRRPTPPHREAATASPMDAT